MSGEPLITHLCVVRMDVSTIRMRAGERVRTLGFVNRCSVVCLCSAMSLFQVAGYNRENGLVMFVLLVFLC